jgi:hypothetical protein
LGKLKRLYRWIRDRKGWLWARLTGIRVPVFPLVWLPDGFSVSHAADTGLVVVENFCTADEAAYLINRAKSRLEHSNAAAASEQTEAHNGMSETAVVFDIDIKDTAVLPILYRAGMLLGLPATHAEPIFVTRHVESQFYQSQQKTALEGERLYTILIYLNDLDDNADSDTIFEKLNIALRPNVGRAVIWTNTNPDGTHHLETFQVSQLVAPGQEKWVIQFGFKAYQTISIPSRSILAPQARRGIPLTGHERLPAGAFAPGEVDPDSPFGKAFI